jgi:hypothetical protein
MRQFVRVAAALLTLAQVHCVHSPGVPAPSPLVLTISPDQATVRLPVGHRSYWWWNTAQTSANALEYEWLVELPSQQVAFGISRFRLGLQQPASGTLSQLIRASHVGVWSIERGRRQLIRDMTVSAAAGDSVVVVTVTDSRTLQLLFATRPQEAWFVARTPWSEPTRVPVRVAYSEPKQ